MNDVRLIAEAATLLFGVGFGLTFAGGRGRLAAKVLLVVATLCGVAYLGARYWLAWPMTPMFLVAVGLPPVLAGLGLISLRWWCCNPQSAVFLLRGVLLLAAGIGALTVCFPKDFYLPFIKTISPFSHAMLVFALLARSSLLLAGIHAAAGLWHVADLATEMRVSLRWLTWGFAFWTLSLFSGELWSYSGWGVPVVWEDATIITAMATWFYYVGLLHLHLTRFGSTPLRAIAAVFGIPLILLLNCVPELGPFYAPWDW